ncbi:hypothetical protein [Nocardia neocaledoniensis]|jgi:hypothetical protein|uniref:hypothetical protein n=1 Tax=Nocardia neocaledoniensis TaxID=236511 RepID=UPI002455F0B1|nr:hypothetical protein [Nocardia neocaledoniensis]
MTDKAYPTADLGIFRVHPCSRRFFYDSPRSLNTCTTCLYSRIGAEVAGEASSRWAEVLADRTSPRTLALSVETAGADWLALSASDGNGTDEHQFHR